LCQATELAEPFNVGHFGGLHDHETGETHGVGGGCVSVKLLSLFSRFFCFAELLSFYACWMCVLNPLLLEISRCDEGKQIKAR
jgi:hypothetical protein